jgi:hypothetical protein
VVVASAAQGSLCEAFTLDEMRSLDSRDWQVHFDEPSSCGYGEPEGAEDWYRFSVSYEDHYTFEEIASDDTSVVLEVGGAPAVFAYGSLSVQVGDELLHFSPAFIDEEEGWEERLLAMSTQAAELTLDDLGPRVPEAPELDATARAEAAGLPGTVAFAWDVQVDRRGDAVISESGEQGAMVWSQVLERLGADADQLSLVEADVSSGLTGGTLGKYARMGVSGVGASTLREAMLATYRDLVGDGLVLEESAIDGHSVDILTLPDGSSAWFHFVDDAAHMIQAPEDVAAMILDAVL